MNENYKELNLANQKEARTSHYKNYKKLVALHKYDPALTHGSYKTFTTNNDTVFGVIRHAGRHYVLLLINFSDDQDQIVNLSHKHLPEFLRVKVASVDSGVREKYVTF